MNTKLFAAILPAALLAAGCATQQTVAVPGPLRAGPNESLAAVVPARGVQIYECRAAKNGGYEWAFVGPEAELFDTNGNRIGTHYAGPHWEALDGSRIVATLKQRADAPRGDAVPWLLLAARSVGPAGSFSPVTSIQRVNTVGGVAPVNGCSRETVGKPARVTYTADYYFYAAR